MADQISLEGFNPFSPTVQQCPHAYYRAMQEGPAVHHVQGTDIFMVTRHDLMLPLLRDTTTFSNAFGSAGEPPKGDVIDRLRAVYADGYDRVPTMLTIDPPWHTRFRGTVAPYFTPRRIAELRAPVEAIVDRLIDDLFVSVGRSGEIDFVPSFAVPLPIEAIAYVLNVPADRLADFKRWSDDSIADIGASISDDRRVEAARGVVEFQHYFAEQLERRRVAPTGDLMSDLVGSVIDDPAAEGQKRSLTMAEMLSIIQQLLVAGNETTTKALTEGMRLLAQHPDQWAMLKADPAGRAPLVTEEVLRLATPTQGMFRKVAAEGVSIDGCPVPKGARVMLVYSAANRDAKVFSGDPDGFDPDRPELKEHLAFGKGIHFCLGAPLSRVEMVAAFERLARRLDTLRLLETNDFEYHPSFMLRGLKKLDLAFTAA